MSIAIHDEAKRLTHMLTGYIEITRLESGTTVLRRSAVRIEALVERTRLALDHWAPSGICLRDVWIDVTNRNTVYREQV